MLSLVISYKMTIASNSVQLSFPVFDFVFLILALLFYSCIIKIYNRMREINMPLVPTLKELKSNIMQLDEANYEMCFDIVMNLSGFILLAIYIILFFLSLLFQKIELSGILAAAVIHLCILAMNFKLTREYYK